MVSLESPIEKIISSIELTIIILSGLFTIQENNVIRLFEEVCIECVLYKESAVIVTQFYARA